MNNSELIIANVSLVKWMFAYTVVFHFEPFCRDQRLLSQLYARPLLDQD